MNPRPHAFRDDTGSATVLGVAVIAALTSLLLMVMWVGAWAVARSHAAMVADLAAIAAAAHGSCHAATITASAHGCEVVECSWHADDVLIAVRAPLAGGPSPLPVVDVRARARAGF